MRLNDYQKYSILDGIKTKSLSKVCHDLQIYKSTAHYFIKRWNRRKNFANISPPGRYQMYDNRTKKKILKEVKINPFTTRRQIKHKLRLNCSDMTISNILKQKGIKNYIARKKNYHNINQIQDRIRFSRKYKSWSMNKLRKIIYLDECSVEFSKDYKRKVWRKRSTALDVGNYVKSNLSFSKRYIKIWGAISYRGKFDLVMIEEKFTSKEYLKILNDHFLPRARELFGNEFYLLEDNDRKHKAGRIKRWKNNNDIEEILIPANSSDLNVIENLWGIIKKTLHQRKYNNSSDLKEAIKNIWNNIPMDIVKKLIDSMKERLIKLNNRNGGPLKY